MKLKKKFSLVSIVLLVMIAIAAVYYFVFFVPGQTELQLIKADTMVYTAEASLYEPYINDPSELEDDIAQAQAELDDLWANGFTNDSTVSLVIGDAIQRYNVNLTSMSLGEETTIETWRALPITVTVDGDYNDILEFISHFENNTEGSYLVHAAALETNGNLTSANIVIYLLTPAI